jgi:hypothetical protein
MAGKRGRPAKEKLPEGRPPIVIDFEELDKLCALQCTQVEICNFFNILEETLAARIKEKTGLSFPEYFTLKRGEGKTSLRRAQFKTAIGDDEHQPNPTMQIWLGKNWLDQKDKSEIENKGTLKVEWPEALKKELG